MRVVPEPEPDLSESLQTALEAIEQVLQRRADARVQLAVKVQVFSAAGWKPAEIQVQLGLTPDEFRAFRAELIAAYRNGTA
jgi:hypothetical protein